MKNKTSFIMGAFFVIFGYLIMPKNNLTLMAFTLFILGGILNFLVVISNKWKMPIKKNVKDENYIYISGNLNKVKLYILSDIIPLWRKKDFSLRYCSIVDIVIFMGFIILVVS